MTAKAVLRAYGLWLLGVLSAAAAAYFLYRSRLVTYELADEFADLGDGNGGLASRVAPYAGDTDYELEDLSGGGAG